jgi:hypothetical protein
VATELEPAPAAVPDAGPCARTLPRGREETTTHVGDDRFAWFATRPSRSRLGFLELLRAGPPEYVINAAAAAYMLERGVPEPVITALLAHERHSFADEAAWSAHLAALGLGAGSRRRVTEAALVGAIVARGLLADTVIVLPCRKVQAAQSSLIRRLRL